MGADTEAEADSEVDSEVEPIGETEDAGALGPEQATNGRRAAVIAMNLAFMVLLCMYRRIATKFGVDARYRTPSGV